MGLNITPRLKKTVILNYATSLSPLLDYVISVKTPTDTPQVCSPVASD